MKGCAADQRCGLLVLTTGVIDIGAWYDIYLAAVAIAGICIRRRKGGIARGLGESPPL